ncbi:aspartokinase [Erysipelotrichaceae bacterium]|nr:aspartokinase [Erysipelotrichaceae bacterium]
MLIVQKYGGSSVANTERIKIVAQRIVDTYNLNNSLVVILSAQGDTTNELLAKIAEITSTPSKRETDMLLATGEQQSVALMSMAIQSLGYPAVSLNAQQVGISSSVTYSNARIEKIENARILKELAAKNIVIIAGFQGINSHGDITTLGRGGSDTSAVALAASLNANLCEIYTDVDGIYTADPRIVADAQKLTEISYDEMLEMASLGANVLHNRSVELAKKNNIKLVVRSSFVLDKGTVVKEKRKMESVYVSGVVSDSNVATISIIGIKDTPGMAYNIFSALALKKISIDIILQSVGRAGTKDIVFTLAESDLADALEVLGTQDDIITCEEITVNKDVAKLSVIGAGIEANPEVAPIMFGALFHANINISMIATSEIKLSVIIDQKDAKHGVQVVHDALIGENNQL